MCIFDPDHLPPIRSILIEALDNPVTRKDCRLLSLRIRRSTELLDPFDGNADAVDVSPLSYRLGRPTNPHVTNLFVALPFGACSLFGKSLRNALSCDSS